MKAEEFYKQRSNSIRELWALSPKQIEYIGLIMEEYAALRQPPVSVECEHPYAYVHTRCMGEINHCLKCGKDL